MSYEPTASDGGGAAAAVAPGIAPPGSSGVTDIQTREQFVTSVQKWVRYDDQIQTLNKQVKSLRDERTALTPQMTRYMEHNNLHDNVIRISDGTLTYKVETGRQGFTQRFLSDALLKYFNNDQARASECMDFIKSQREQTQTVTLKRSYKAEEQ